MKRIMLIFLLAGILLTGAITQTYTLEIKKTGESRITQTTDTSLYDVGGNEMKKMVLDACKNVTAPYSCKIESNMLAIGRDATPDEGGYVFEANYGLLTTDYKLVINSVPLDKFNNAIANAMGNQNTGINSIDLTVNNSEYAKAFEVVDLNVSYIIKMPGEINAISSGSVTGKRSGNVGEINLLEVMKGGNKITVTSNETNWSAIVFIIGIMVVIGLAVSIVTKKKN